MATTAAEFKPGLTPEQLDILTRGLETLREKIARAMGALGATSDDPRWVESNIRLNPEYRSVTFIESVTDARIEADVQRSLDAINANYSPTFWDARAEAQGIPATAYTDIFKRLGFLS